MFSQGHTPVSLFFAGRHYAIQSLKARESLNAPIWAEVIMPPLAGYDPDDLPGQAMSLRLQGADGGERWLHAHLTEVVTGGASWHITLHSRLFHGHFFQKSRLFPDLSRCELIQILLDEIGYERDQIDWRIELSSDANKERAPMIQAAETHLDCFNRLLSEVGWNYWFEDQGCGREMLIISDRFFYPSLDLPPMFLPQEPPSAALSDMNCLAHFRFSVQMQPQGVTQASHLRGADYHIIGHGHWQTFAPPLAPEAAEQRVRQQEASLQQQQIRYTFSTHQPRLQVGQRLLMRPGRLPPLCPDFGDALLVLELEHSADQPSPEHPRLLRYINHATACHGEHSPYPSPLTLGHEHPLIFPAAISGMAREPQPDRSGEYYFHHLGCPDLRSLYPGLLLRPYAGDNAGWHFPLLGESHVLVTLLNGDPHRPLILGFLPDGQAPGPVVRNNARQHRLVTPGKNELLLDDDVPCIRLQSINKHLHIELNALDGEPFLRLMAHHGVISLKAAGDLYLRAKERQQIRIAGERHTQVHNQYRARVEGKVHWQSGKQVHLESKSGFEHRAQGNMAYQLAEGLKLQIKKDLKIRTAQGHHFNVPAGSHLVRVGKDIRIEGQGGGDVVLGNEQAGIKLDSNGQIKLYGKSIQLKGSQVGFRGLVNYDTSGGHEPESLPQPPKAAERPLIQQLIFEEAVQHLNASLLRASD